MGSILQVLPAFHAGGVEQTTFLVANALAEQGFGSFIASAGGLMTKKLHPNVMHIYLPLNTKNPYLMFSNAKKLKTIIADNHINIIHARSRAPAWSAYFAAKEMNAHFLTTYHGAYSQNFLKWHYNRVMALGNPVIVASQYMENHVLDYYPEACCVKIPSGINTDYFSPNNSTKKTLGFKSEITDDVKVILLVGRFTRIKGHQILLQAASKSAFRSQLVVIFVGDSKNLKLVSELKNEAEMLSIKLHIHVDEKDLRPFFNRADVVIIPTTKPEAFGRVTVEAMSMSKVVIVNDLGASSEVLSNSDWVFSHNIVESLTQKIDIAVGLNAEKAQAIGVANRSRAISFYNIEKLIEGHLQVYKSIIKAKQV